MDKNIDSITASIKKGSPIYITPYKEPKVWGVKDIGEYWYGAEKGNKSSTAHIDGQFIPMAELIEKIPSEILGVEVIKKFGCFLPLVKILTPKSRLSVQFHDAKDELWIVTGIDAAIAKSGAKLIIGFNPELLKQYGGEIKDKYLASLEKYGKSLNILIDEMESCFKNILNETKDVFKAAKIVCEKNEKIKKIFHQVRADRKMVDNFYNYLEVKAGDVIPVPKGTLHALGAGIEIIEPQIPGPTQSLEDGETYPVRYYFPFYPREGASKKLDLDRVGEMSAEVWDKGREDILFNEDGVKIERMPGGFESKGLAVHRVNLDKGKTLSYNNTTSYHIFVAVTGSAKILINSQIYDIPKATADGKMLIIPAVNTEYKILAEEFVQFIDTFTPA
ncbi:hypothetical protein OMAG_000914 [Candidatus Omnitrophus magneticus]|uniref:Uncharacterized protein n=1 Tax=Candidatus Omnitrophus magneticus TaxID=1609969 RepID=A0A0F0CPM4_9BACT|nr:hypothetical protein OMAG_000914 [Candidatus Omnitrophus magneticus]